MARQKQNPFDLLAAQYEAGKAAGRWASQRNFAEEIGVSYATAVSWLQRIKRPGGWNAYRLQKMFGIDAELWREAA